MIDEKGSSFLFIIVVAIILSLIVGSLITGAFAMTVRTVVGTDLSCPTFCAVQADIEEYSMADIMLPSVLPFIEESSDGIAHKVADWIIQPEGLGCYCGVKERSGRYIHFHTGPPGERSIRELHLTDQDPHIHLDYHVGDSDGNTLFDHSFDKSNCEEDINSLKEVQYYQDVGCVIVVNSDGGYCSIHVIGEGSVIENNIGESIQDQVEIRETLTTNYDENDPISFFEIGDRYNVPRFVHEEGDILTYTIGGQPYQHDSQRMLLRDYDEYLGAKFALYAPVVCRTSVAEGQEVQTKLDEKCREQCKEDRKIFLSSACHDIPREGYKPLRDEHHEEDTFCEKEGKGPYCRCMHEIRYYWEVDEDYSREN